LYQRFQNSRLERALRQIGVEVPSGAATTTPRAIDGMVGRLEIPRLGLSAIVKEGTDSRTLLIAVGHVLGTALPGEHGNVVVSGHRDSFFRDLREIRTGDDVTITTVWGAYQYRVDSTTVVEPGQTEVLGPTEVPTLTLITCFPFDYIGPAPKRFIVKARQVKRVA
jgi:sortase A